MITYVLAVVMLGPQEPVPDRPVDPSRVAALMTQPKLVKRKEPRYPEDAARAGLGGIVLIEAHVDEKGAVSAARVLKGVSPLSEAAVKAVKEWRYAPLLLDGTATPFVLTVTINFNRGFQFNLDDLLGSLHSKNEFVRESAVAWLGRARSFRNLNLSDVADIRRRVRLTAETDESERVRAAAAKALTRLDAK